MIIKVNDLDKLNLEDSITPLYGNTSQIYSFGKNYYFKLLKKGGFFNRGYQNLHVTTNMYLFNMVLELSKLENVPLFNKPIYIFKSNNLFYGYVSLKINGNSLNKLDDNIEILNLFNSVNLLRYTVMNICKSGIIPNDIYGGNILYDDKLILIDLDYSYHDKNVSLDEAYTKTMYDIFLTVKNMLLKGIWEYANYPVLEDIEIIKGISRKLYIEDYRLIKLEKDYENGNLDDYSIYFNSLIDIVNNATDKKITTLGELKRNLIVKKK